MNNVIIVDAARSPVGKKNGSLGGAHPTDVLGQVMMKLLDRNGVSSSQVNQVVGGCINKVAAQGMNVIRTAWLAHGGAVETPCITIDSQCGSSQQSTTLAHSILASGHADVVMACGVENMTRLPIGSDSVGKDPKMGKPVSKSYFEQHEFTSQFEGAERVAEKYQITRQDADGFGLESQLRARKAIASGYFDSQIIPVEAPVMDDNFEKTGKTITVTLVDIP